jgi:UDP-N-acetylglucosamine/UDP-N-acetylgalactosamine diphosphorylase
MGVFALRGQPPAVQVVEYSELSAEAAASVVAAGGRLRFNWGNMAMHYFSLSFLQRAAAEYATGGMYHVARKRIPTVHGNNSPALLLPRPQRNACAFIS